MSNSKTLKVGQTVSYIGAGKVARLEGMAGKKCIGTIVAINDDDITVLPKHRTLKDAVFKGNARLTVNQVTPV